MFISMPKEFFIPVVYVEGFILNEVEETSGFRSAEQMERESTEKKPVVAPSQNVIESTDALYIPLKTEIECKINTTVLNAVDDEFIECVSKENSTGEKK